MWRWRELPNLCLQPNIQTLMCLQIYSCQTTNWQRRPFHFMTFHPWSGSRRPHSSLGLWFLGQARRSVGSEHCTLDPSGSSAQHKSQTAKTDRVRDSWVPCGDLEMCGARWIFIHVLLWSENFSKLCSTVSFFFSRYWWMFNRQSMWKRYMHQCYWQFWVQLQWRLWARAHDELWRQVILFLPFLLGTEWVVLRSQLLFILFW